MTTTSIRRFTEVAGTAILVMIANVLISILYITFYGYVINPNQTIDYYQTYARVAAPYCSIIAGIPLMFVAGRWLGKRRNPSDGVHAAISMWLVYSAIDLYVLVLGSRSLRLMTLTAISLTTKFAGAYLGGRAGAR